MPAIIVLLGKTARNCAIAFPPDCYGTIISRNGSHYAGAVWTIDSAGTFTIIHQVAGKADGFGPNGR